MAYPAVCESGNVRRPNGSYSHKHCIYRLRGTKERVSGQLKEREAREDRSVNYLEAVNHFII